jgi:hypothetical protein
LYPAGRPLEILTDAFRFGKVVGAIGKGQSVLTAAKISTKRDGVFVAKSVGDEFGEDLKEGLRTFKFLDRFALDA